MQFTCECGMVFRKVKRWPLHCHCGRHYAQLPANATEPSLIVKVASFCAEKAKWYAAGAPVRTTELQTSLLAFCSGCSYFDQEKVKCKACGCNLKAAVKMATKQCPHQKWPVDKPIDTASPEAT